MRCSASLSLRCVHVHFLSFLSFFLSFFLLSFYIFPLYFFLSFLFLFLFFLIKFDWFFFTGKSFVKYILYKFTKEFPLNWSRTSSRKIYKRIPYKFEMGSFYKGFPREFFFPRKSFVKFFWNFKLESDFFPHVLSKIWKLENSAHLFILNYNWANFRRNRRPKNSSLFFTFFHYH